MCGWQLAWQPLPSAISEGPAMSWWLVQGVPCPRPETVGIGSSKKPCDPIKGMKWLQTMDGSLCPKSYIQILLSHKKSKQITGIKWKKKNKKKKNWSRYSNYRVIYSRGIKSEINSPDSILKSLNYVRCWDRKHFINVLKCWIWHVPNHSGLLVNSAHAKSIEGC